MTICNKKGSLSQEIQQQVAHATSEKPHCNASERQGMGKLTAADNRFDKAVRGELAQYCPLLGRVTCVAAGAPADGS